MPLARALALLLALEGLLLTGLGVAYGVASLAADGDQLPAQLAAGAAVLTGLVLLVLARGADRGRGWARSPAVVLNLFPFPLAVNAVEGGRWLVALAMVVLPLAVLALFASPALRELFRERG